MSNKTKKIVELVDEFFETNDVMTTKDWDEIVFSIEKTGRLRTKK